MDFAFTRAVFRWPKRANLCSGRRAVVLWASWPALATIAYPAPPFLVLGLSAFVGFVFSYLIVARRKHAHEFFAVRKRTMLFVAFGLMGNNAFLRSLWTDSVAVARKAWPELRGNGGHGLANLKKRMLELQFRHHDAGEDGRAAAEVILKAETSLGTNIRMLNVPQQRGFDF